eukprot:9188135-Prorocentrum_lima.AAC.1
MQNSSGQCTSNCALDCSRSRRPPPQTGNLQNRQNTPHLALDSPRREIPSFQHAAKPNRASHAIASLDA